MSTQGIKTFVLHGLAVRSPMMWLLGSRLKKAGFEIHYFNYSTTRESFENSVEKLVREIETHEAHDLNLVGHSLGGLLGVSAAQRLQGKRGSIVALGSPFGGSSVGQWLSKNRVGRAILGSASEVFEKSLTQHDLGPEWRVGVIAGTGGIGIGRISPVLSGPHDGTVSVAETILTNAPHVTVKATHTGLVTSKYTAELVVRFLKTSSF